LLNKFVGGPEHTYVLLPCLERLARVEEQVVREKAVATTIALLGSIGPDHLVK
jgi:hypothetical protein